MYSFTQPKAQIHQHNTNAMKRRFERKYSMYNAVKGTLINANPATIAQMPKMDEAIVELTENIDFIEDFGREQSENRTGIASDKEVTREDVVNNFFILCGQVRSLATNENDIILKDSLNFPISRLQNMADGNLIIAADFIRLKAEENIAELADYGVTPGILTTKTNLLTTFRNKLAEPRREITKKKLATQELTNVFKKTDVLLKETMDILVIIVKETVNPFYKAYQNNRIIVDEGSSPLALRCFVTDENEQPLEKVTAVINGINRTYKTTAKGKFQIKSLPSGTYTITLSRPTYETKTTTFGITKGIRTDLYITLKQLEP